MTTDAIRAEFDKVIAGAESLGDKDAAARMEVAREYFTNPDFKKKLADYVFAATYSK